MSSSAEQQSGTPSGKRGQKWSLVRLVAVGTITTLTTGSALFYFFAWLQTEQPYDPIAWFDDTTGQILFDAARTTVTILGILGLGGAALIAYRKQRTTEDALTLDTHSQRTAAKAAKTGAKAAKTGAKQLQLDSKRQRHDATAALHVRYKDAAAQLGSASLTVRLAGVYAIASLADDWHKAGNDPERKVCIDLLCASLRMEPDAPSTAIAAGTRADPNEREVRETIVNVIQARVGHGDSDIKWPREEAAFVRAKLAGVWLRRAKLEETNFHRADLDGADLYEADLTGANLGRATLRKANLEHANLRGANLEHANLRGANLEHADLRSATLENGKTRSADLHDARLEGADLHDAHLEDADLHDARLEGADLHDAHLQGADLRAATMNEHTKLDGAHWTRTKLDRRMWPPGVPPPPDARFVP